jgi:hypothetical protein
MATGLLVVILGLAALAFERNSLALANAAGLLGLVLGLQHGYDLFHIYAFVGCLTLWLGLRDGLRVRPFLLGAAICVWSLPAALYLASLTRLDAIWRGVLAQYGNAGIYTPAPALLPVMFGLPLVLLLIYRPPAAGPVAVTPREALLRIWLVVGFLMLYVPTDFQIKMLAGWQIPVSILAVRALLRGLAPALARRRGRPAPAACRRRWPAAGLLAALAVAVVIPVNLYLFAWRFVDLNRHDYPFYLHRDDAAALSWLDTNAGASDIVLSSLAVGQYVPGFTNSRPYLAHWAQTLDYFRRRDEVARFYDAAEADAARRALLRREGITYIIRGPAEEAVGAFQPAGAPYLRPVHTTGRTVVYRVHEEP